MLAAQGVPLPRVVGKLALWSLCTDAWSALKLGNSQEAGPGSMFSDKSYIGPGCPRGSDSNGEAGQGSRAGQRLEVVGPEPGERAPVCGEACGENGTMAGPEVALAVGGGFVG